MTRDEAVEVSKLLWELYDQQGINVTPSDYNEMIVKIIGDKHSRVSMRVHADLVRADLVRPFLDAK